MLPEKGGEWEKAELQKPPFLFAKTEAPLCRSLYPNPGLDVYVGTYTWNLSGLEMSPCVAEGRTRRPLEAPSNPNSSMSLSLLMPAHAQSAVHKKALVED